MYFFAHIIKELTQRSTTKTLRNGQPMLLSKEAALNAKPKSEAMAKLTPFRRQLPHNAKNLILATSVEARRWVGGTSYGGHQAHAL